MKVVVSGSSGLIGEALLAHLRAEAHDVVRLVRRRPLAGEAGWDPGSGSIDAAALVGCDAAVNLAGVGIGDRRWSASRRQSILQSRVGSTVVLCRALAGLDPRPRVVVSASAVGIYGDRGDEVLTEDSALGDGFPAFVCKEWEAATSPATEAGIRVVNLRSAVVLSRRGGALARQLPLFKTGLGGRLGDGKQWFSWISIRDEVRAILHLLESTEVAGPVNCASPNPVTNAQFTRCLAAALHRPAVAVVPRFVLRLALGRALADEFVLSSLRVAPAHLERSGFVFEHPTLEGALTSVLGRGQNTK